MIKPHGSDQLNPLFVYDSEKRNALIAEAENLPSLLLNSAAAANAVMLGGGYFNPLTGYMNLADSLSIAEKMHTVDGLFFPVPIVNLTNETGLKAGTRIALRDPNVKGNPVLAIMDIDAVEQVSDAQIHFMAEKIFRTLDPKHPGVATFTNLGRTMVSGPIQVLNFSYFQTDFPDTFRTAVDVLNYSTSRGTFRSAGGSSRSSAETYQIFTGTVLVTVPMVGEAPGGRPVIDFGALATREAGKFFGFSAFGGYGPSVRGVNPSLIKLTKAKSFPKNFVRRR